MSNSVCSVFRILDVLISMQYVHWMRINSDLFVTWVGFFGWVGVFFVVFGYFNPSYLFNNEGYFIYVSLSYKLKAQLINSGTLTMQATKLSIPICTTAYLYWFGLFWFFLAGHIKLCFIPKNDLAAKMRSDKCFQGRAVKNFILNVYTGIVAQFLSIVHAFCFEREDQIFERSPGMHHG